jgi:hypothetical protein
MTSYHTSRTKDKYSGAAARLEGKGVKREYPWDLKIRENK